jgi:hypothetical protein
LTERCHAGDKAMSSQFQSAETLSFVFTERRESTRFPKEPGTDFAVIWRNRGDEQLVEVLNESLGGICIVMADVANFPVGAEATLVYHNDVLRGIVRHIQSRDDGMYLVGFECR